MTGELFLSRFTPSMMSADLLEKVFVQRGDIADRITEVVRESILTPSKHHILVVGSRGIGKTHLLSLVHNRISGQEDLNDQVRIAWLREEEWGVASFLDFLYRVLRALAARYGDDGLQEQTESLFSLSLKTAEQRAGDLLREFVGDRTLLLIAENLDSTFAGLAKKGQQRLRAYLQEESSWTILGSSQALFAGITLYESPFYGFFEIHHLQELTVEDAARLIGNVAELANDSELAAYVQRDAGLARIRAVHHLAGGNHRVYMILSEFLTRESLDQLVEPFLRMMDDLTPYYQARMEQLSPQQRKIIDLLCSVRGAVPVKEIAKRCFITPQTTSSQLKDLRERGYVDSTPVGRDTYYEIAEPLMRLALEVKNQRDGHVRLFLDFLRYWYARKELMGLLERTPIDASIEREYLERVLAEEEGTNNPHIQHLVSRCAELRREEEWAHALPVAQKLVEQRGGVWDWTILGQCLGNLGAGDEAVAALNRALEVDSGFALAWMFRAVTLFQVNRTDEAIDAITTATKIEENPSFYRILAIFLEDQNRLDEALDAITRSVKLAPDNQLGWALQGELLAHMGKLNEAVVSSEEAIKLDPQSVELKVLYGEILNRLGEHSKAARVFEDILERVEPDLRLADNYAVALVSLGQFKQVLAQATPSRLDRLFQSEPDQSPLRLSSVIVVSLLYMQSYGEAIRNKVRMYYDVYRRHDRLGILAACLLISGVAFRELGADESQNWLALWRDIVGSDEYFVLPLKLLDVLVRYQKTGDQRVLLGVPAEERRVVEEMLQDSTGSQLVRTAPHFWTKLLGRD
jgi:tetratricopeptide (TPR) repeat protein